VMVWVVLFLAAKASGNAGWIKGWIGVWLASLAQMIILGLVMPAITGAIMGDTTIPSTGDTTSVTPTLPKEITFLIDNVVPFLPFVHLVLLPIFAYRKLLFKKRPVPEDPAAAVLDPDAKTVIFAQKMACCDKIICLTIGTFLDIVSFIIKVLGYIGLDLKSIWFPEPFYQFYTAKLELKAYQIDGAKFRFDARQEDAYLKFQFEGVMNFFTLGLFGMCCGKKTNYNRWLDTKVKWRGAPPPGYNQQFRIFFTKLTCCQKIKREAMILVLNFVFGGAASKIPLVGPFIPVSLLGMYVDVFTYRMLLSNYRFGGSKPHFNKKMSWCNYIYAYYVVACLGLCMMKLKRWVDAKIEMGPPVFEAGFDDDAPADEPAMDDASTQPATQPAVVASPPVAVAVAQPAPPVAELVAVAAVAPQASLQA